MKVWGGIRKVSMTCTMPPVNRRSCECIVSMALIWIRKGQSKGTAYRRDECRATADAAREDVDRARLLYASDHLTAGDVGIGGILQPGFVK